MEIQVIHIPEITLKWSDWHPWNALKVDARQAGGISVPKEPGVYEVKYEGNEVRLTIGKTGNLRQRVKRSLVMGNRPHSAGKRIRACEDLSQLAIRWAVTDRSAAVEEELLRRYQELHGTLPKHTRSTR